ncbi:MAG: hypothetical protein IJ932_01995 [Ruminococcus sp.]|nr:hypothetical protein [Ruminococcus sp.]
MDIKGLWKVDKILGFDDDFNQIWKDAQAILNDSAADDDEKNMAKSVVEFGDDGIIKMMMPLPEGISQEEIDAAVAEGEIEVSGDMMIAEKHPWKEEDGKIFFDSGIEGEAFGEEVSSWQEVTVTDNGIELFTFKLIKA